MRKLWDAITGLPIGEPMNNLAKVWAVAFSPDGKTILTANMAGAAQLWNARTGLPMGKLTLRQSYYFGPVDYHGRINALAFSPDGKAILTGSDDWTARLWDAATGQSIGQPMFHGANVHYAVRPVAFSPDGKTVLTGSDDNAAQALGFRYRSPHRQAMEHEGSVQAVAFSPDGKTILTGSTENKARLWDRVTGEPIGKPMEHEGRVTAVAFSPDGKPRSLALPTPAAWTGRFGSGTPPPVNFSPNHWSIEAALIVRPSAPTANGSSFQALTEWRGYGTA